MWLSILRQLGIEIPVQPPIEINRGIEVPVSCTSSSVSSPNYTCIMLKYKITRINLFFAVYRFLELNITLNILKSKGSPISGEFYVLETAVKASISKVLTDQFSTRYSLDKCSF